VGRALELERITEDLDCSLPEERLVRTIYCLRLTNLMLVSA
jgi:hypothetical protein